MSLQHFSAPIITFGLLAVGCQSGKALDCDYVARENERNPTPYDQELQARGLCAILASDGTIIVQRDHLNDLKFIDGLAAIRLPNGWVYVTHDGRAAPVVTYDNGPDYFEEGLARTSRGGKFGFIDKNLSEVIAPTWDFAFPFVGGFAAVCEGCRGHRIDDEHSELRGGRWGYIDRSGQVVVPVEYERVALPRPNLNW